MEQKRDKKNFFSKKKEIEFEDVPTKSVVAMTTGVVACGGLAAYSGYNGFMSIYRIAKNPKDPDVPKNFVKDIAKCAVGGIGSVLALESSIAIANKINEENTKKKPFWKR